MESVRPDGPTQSENLLELPSTPAAEPAVTSSGSPELVLPDAAEHAPREPAAADEPTSPTLPAPATPVAPGAVVEPASPPVPLAPAAEQAAPIAPAAPGPLGNLVAAHFQRVETAMLGRVLVATLAGALPASMIQVQRRRSLSQRLSGKPGQPIGITITAGERMLSFHAPEIGVTEAKVAHAVRGVVLSSSLVPVSEWLDQLGELLNEVARNDAATRVALEQALLH